MLIVFAYELKPDEYTSEDKINQMISGFPAMPSDAKKSIESFQMFSPEILQEVELGKGYGDFNSRTVYFVWELFVPPSIGWMFCCPFDLDFSDLNTITNIYFGTGDVLLCEYE